MEAAKWRCVPCYPFSWEQSSGSDAGLAVDYEAGMSGIWRRYEDAHLLAMYFAGTKEGQPLAGA